MLTQALVRSNLKICVRMMMSDACVRNTVSPTLPPYGDLIVRVFPVFERVFVFFHTQEATIKKINS